MAKAPRTTKVPKETTEQAKFVSRVRHFWPDVLVLAIPNGGGRSKAEAARLKEEGVLAGASDLLVLEPRGGWHGLFVEMKRQRGGRVSPEQRDFIARATQLGYRAAVAEGADEAWRIFLEHMELPRTAVGQDPLLE